MYRSLALSAVLTFLTLLSMEPRATAATRGAVAPPSAARHVYIVQMREAPVATYRGEIKGFAATKPAKGRRIDKRDPNVSRYSDYLRAQHDAVLRSVGGGRKLYSYSFAVNGFSAELTDLQADKLRANPNVALVRRNEIRKMATVTTPSFLGLDAPNGIWDRLGGARHAGENVIIGVIDSGIWPEHPSFAPRNDGGPIPDFTGICQPGEAFPATSCNDKIIGARYFTEGFGGDEAVKALFPYEFISPRAADSHGVHTAATAAGNFRVRSEVVAGEETYRLGRVSGMAPGARLAIYKACWGFSDDPAGGCTFVDTVAAIDQAVADGVEIINYSISGSTDVVLDPVTYAFLFAADAGVFVAAAAGNEGPDPGTVNHIAPWITTVGASTHDRRFNASVTLANGARFSGSGMSSRAVPSTPIVLSSDAGLEGQDPTEVALCFPGTLDPAVVTDKIVVCDRGISARIEKSQVVADAGGVGMILVNVSPGTTNADAHSVPTVHVDVEEGAAIKAYVANASNPRASLSAGVLVTGRRVPAPDVADLSSRGPALAAGGDLLKPDIIAPGIDVLAAASPVERGTDFDLLSGTSMASPHVAGIAALIKEQHPDWSPAAIKSAMMTTATGRRNNGTLVRELPTNAPANPFEQGAGLVQVNDATQPGLVYEAGLGDWLAFLCGTGEACFVPGLSIDPSHLNYPSISIGALAGSQTVRRTVTNVGGRFSLYRARLEAPRGVSVQVSPKLFRLRPGESKTYTVKLTTRSAPLNEFAFGSLTWTDGRHDVRSPIAVRPVALSAPAEVSSNGDPIRYSVGFGYTGRFTAMPRGLIPATTDDATVQDDPNDDINTALDTGVGITVIPVVVPEGTTFARFSLFDANTDGNDDLDLYVFRGPDFSFVDLSGNATSNEEVSLVNPLPDTYMVVVHGFQTDGPDAAFTLFSWTLGSESAGNMTVTAPTRATQSGTGTITLSFSELEAGTKYLGSVVYGGAAEIPDPTIVRVDP